MASPRRARSLFLSPEKAELLAAREINNLLHRVEVVPRKAGPRQARRTDIVMDRDSGDERHMSKASTINAVGHFCEEYRPPSVALHRLSYLNKELPPPPLSESTAQIPHQSNAVSRVYKQKHAACQTVISIHSRYSTPIKPSTPSRLSIISSQEGDSGDRISIRSRYSTQDPIPIDNTVSRSNTRASVAIDRWRPPDVGKESGKSSRRQTSGSISPSTIPHHEMVSEVVDQTIAVVDPQETKTNPGALQIIPQKPLVGTKSREMVPRSRSDRKASVGWTFHDGLILRNDDRLQSTTGTSTGNANLDLGAKSKHMIPIHWSFHEGMIFRADQCTEDEDGTSKAKSKRMIPIGWSFYEGFAFRPDGSIEAISKATGRSEEIVPRSKSKRMIPIGWTFQEGLIFTIDDSVRDALTSSDKSKDIESEARAQRLPIAWSFHDGFILGNNAKVRDTSKKACDNIEVATMPRSKRTVGWTFTDGLIIKNGGGMSPNNGGIATRTQSKRSVTWSFSDGLIIKTHVGASLKNRKLATGTSPRQAISWSFHDGLVIGTNSRVAKRSGQNRSTSTSTESKGMSASWGFYEGLTIKQRSNSKGKGKGKGVDRNLHPLFPKSNAGQRRRITYTFWDGVTMRTIDGASSRALTQSKSKLGWTFHDGICRTTVEPSNQVSTWAQPKRTYGWTFYDGLRIEPNVEAGTFSKTSSAIRGPAFPNSRSAQLTNRDTLSLPNEKRAELFPKKPSEDAVSDVPNEAALDEGQLDSSQRPRPLPSSIPPKEPDLSPKSKPPPPSSSSSGVSYFSAQPGSSNVNLAPVQDRPKRPPTSRANTRLETSPSVSDTRYYVIEKGKAVAKDAFNQPPTPNSNKDATPLPLKPRIRQKPLRSRPSLEDWDGTFPRSTFESATRRRQRSKTKLPIENGNGIPPALAPRRKDVPPPTASKYRIEHIEDGNAVPTSTGPLLQPQALSAMRKNIIAGY
ncbi:hypothetical protein HO173_000146 [Letharia columbiana]|uniref:Uncharacterized protein n=1 Tax=Letharia columbiana TaxID=112416 RepID=A0A8H6LA32_9LECA|nr:uncharacterized protein HO173_000146 [Letharia columbiana]KAF6241436.1 hypothetical protein HO173_000146 [Letharia columbiana]